MPIETVFERGLMPEAIVGELLRPLEAGETITPEIFARNPAFVKFMHEVIARRGPGLPGLIAEARRQVDGIVCVIDQRTPNPEGHIPPEDIVGVFAVKAGSVVPGSYQNCPKHQLLSARGFFQLVEELQTCLLEELGNLYTQHR